MVWLFVLGLHEVFPFSFSSATKNVDTDKYDQIMNLYHLLLGQYKLLYLYISVCLSEMFISTVVNLE